MNRTDAPKKQPVPFGINGSREDLLATTPAGDNQASYDVGFPPVTMILKSAGGRPPKGQDMNQILFELSAIGRWLSAGSLNTFDATFATAIAGYPKGAVLLSDDGTTIYVSTADANTNNPNSVSTGWLNLLSFLGGAPSSSPALTGVPTAPTAATGTSTTQIATTAFVHAITDLLAPLASPALTGTPTAPTAATGTSTTQLATTAFVQAALTALLPKRSFIAGDSIRIPDVPGGLIIQWGSKTLNASGGTSILFASVFPTICLGIVMSPNDADTSANYRVSATSAAVNGFTGVTTKPQATAITYIAIGY
ncbi:phage tail protein [Dickeya zeae]|uniref:gp53-like domain-containing protein n=1 Tax=Dickeya zeae TaxID=204042 RepID=UPI0003A68406|nr:phage tail protein [Dickeya zeae]